MQTSPHQRVGFLIRLRKEKLADYIRHHNPIWPELVAELKAAGMRNYTLWLDREACTEFGYLECDDWKAVCAYLEKSEVHTRWQEFMKDYLLSEQNRGEAGQPVKMLERVFLLE
jgi:L-rhamnose mutarotase